MTKLTGILLDVKEGVKRVQTSMKLNELYKMLNCEYIDVVRRKINGKYFYIICDDEGWLKNDPTVSAINRQAEPMLAGNLLILGYQPNEERSLTDWECEHIIDSLRYLISEKGLTPVVFKMDY